MANQFFTTTATAPPTSLSPDAIGRLERLLVTESGQVVTATRPPTVVRPAPAVVVRPTAT